MINLIILTIYLAIGISAGISVWNNKESKEKTLYNFIMNVVCSLIWPIGVIVYVCSCCDNYKNNK